MTQVLEMPTQPIEHLPAAPTVAALTNITKRYANGVVALNGLSLELRRGEVVALLGPNGAGKSTAVKLMMGLTSPTSGSVRIFGADPRLTSTRLRTGVMLQVGRAPEMLKVREHIATFRSYYDQPASVASLVRAAGLEGLENRLFGQLSGGQKQRVLFALALAGNPDLVFLDEPTVGLDIEARRGMWAEIRALRDAGKTVLLTTHYLEEADALADRIIVIHQGSVVREGTPAEIKNAGALRAAGGVDTGTQSAAMKIIRCVTTLTGEHLRAMPGVSSAVTEGVTTIVLSALPEATLREMLAIDASLHSLEVQSPALEDAFLALTRNDQ
jgi:ABC-2 type transport system ATP-binding protein